MALIPLKILDAQSYLDKLTSLEGQAEAYAKMGAPKLPGIPDIKQEVKKLLEAEKDKIVDKAREELITLLTLIMGAGIAKLAGLEDEINFIIKTLNSIITAIGVAMAVLAAIAAATFVVIIAITIIVVVTKIIGLIPSIVVAFGTGVSFDMPKFIATETMSIATFLLGELWPVASNCIAVMYMLLKIYSILVLCMGILKIFTMKQAASVNTASDSFNRTADDWSNAIGGSTDDDLIPNMFLVECTLPNGTVKQMSAADCIAAGGTFPEMDLLKQLNEVNLKLRECTGANSNTKECIALRLEYNDLMHQLGDLSEFQLGDSVITSLLYLNDGATIENATENTGKRKGFYQSDIKK